ncbi:MAG: hypothetical protein ACTTIC_03875 [Helicobacteraceae bacterium]
MQIPSSHSGAITLSAQGGFIYNLGADFSGLEVTKTFGAGERLDIRAANISHYGNSYKNAFLLAFMLQAAKNDARKAAKILAGADILAEFAALKNSTPNAHLALDQARKAYDSGDNAEQIKAEDLRLSLESYMKDVLSENLNEQGQKNLADLSKMIVSKTGASPKGTGFRSLARGLNVKNILTRTNLEKPSPDFNIDAGALRALGRVHYFGIEQKIAMAEALGQDETKRKDYFFSSTASPFAKLDLALANITDSLLTDTMQGRIAAIMAKNGLLQRALELIDYSIYAAKSKAQAHKMVGAVLQGAGKGALAAQEYSRALDLADTYFSVEGFDANDASFYQFLFTRLKDLGAATEANKAHEKIERYLKSEKNKYYTTAYGRIIAALGNALRDALEKYGAGALSKEAVKAAIDELKFWTQNAKQQLKTGTQTPDATGCYKMKAYYLSIYANAYAHIGEKTLAKEGAEAFFTTLKETCNSGAAAYLKDIASVFADLNELEHFKELMDSAKSASNEHKKAIESNEQKISQFFIYAKALSGALDSSKDLSGIISQTFTELETRADGLKMPNGKPLDKNSIAKVKMQNKLEVLTYLGTNKQTPFIALSLINRGDKTRAKTAVDKAKDIALNDEYIKAHITNPVDAVERGCAKVADLYKMLDETSAARETLETCRVKIQAQNDKKQIVRNLLALAQSWQGLGVKDKALELVDLADKAIESGANNQFKLTQKGDITNVYIHFGEFGKARDLIAAMDAIDKSATSAPFYFSFTLMGKKYADLIDAIKRTADANGLTPEKIALVKEARSKIAALAKAGLDLAPYKKNKTESDKLSEVDHEKRVGEIIALLAKSKLLDSALDLAAKGTKAQNKERLKAVADGVLSSDDFPAHDFASFDYDDDGRPDFFSDDATPEQKAKLALDEDIDGDGINDTADLRPYKKD